LEADHGGLKRPTAVGPNRRGPRRQKKNKVGHGGYNDLNFLILIKLRERGNSGHDLQPKTYCTTVVFVFFIYGKNDTM
jgi:hypothetical protein